MGTPFPSQASHDNGHTQAVLWDTFPKPGFPCYRPHTGGAMGGGMKIGDTFPNPGSP